MALPSLEPLTSAQVKNSSLSQIEIGKLIDKVEKKTEDSELFLNIKAYEYRNQLIVAAQYVLSKLGTAGLAIVLGSGLGGFSALLKNTKELTYKEIPFLPEPSVKGHSGKIIMGDLISADGKTTKRIMCFAGRLHAYEGYPMYQCTFCCRLAYLVGCHTIVITNAAGGCIQNQTPGSVVIMTDYIRDVHYNVMNHSRNDFMFGQKYLTGYKLIDDELINLFEKTAKKCNFPHYKGHYWWASGPAYETSTQVKYIISSHGHAVGMSTVPEILAAKNLGLRVGALSLCTNVAAGLKDEALSHDIVVQEAAKASKNFSNFVVESLLQIEDPKDWKPVSSKLRLTNYLKPLISNDNLFPRKFLFTYHDLYNDIIYLRSFLNQVLDLKLGEKAKRFQFTEPNRSGYLVSKNRKGPIVVWILHEPFTFDTSQLTCPVVFPMDLLPGWSKILTSSSGKEACLYFGLDKMENFVVVVTGLGLEGWKFDEANFFVNLIYGVISHKNIYFMNLFYAFDAKTLYSDEMKDEDEVYGLIHDAVDFRGGPPRYPFPLFPPKDYNTTVSKVRIKHASFSTESKKTIGTVLSCLEKSNKNKKTKKYTYGFWPGPNFPTPTELKITQQANCSLVGVSDPFMTPMCRQLGHDGYTIAKIANKKTINNILNSNNLESIDQTAFINDVTTQLILKFGDENITYPFSPASINRAISSTAVTDEALKKNLFNVKVPKNAPQYFKIKSVQRTFKLLQDASNYISEYWDFNKRPIKNALFSSFSHVFGLRKKECVCTIDLKYVPGWAENFCGGYPFSHYHWNNTNPFEWVLKIYRNVEKEEDLKEDEKSKKTIDDEEYEEEDDEFDEKYYICISPMFFESGKTMKERKKLLSSFYKYAPIFWNLDFIVRVLWLCGCKNVNYLTHLRSNPLPKNATIKSNTLVCINNFVETSKWNVLTGPNDERIGPRFTPITDPFEYCADFVNMAKKEFNKNIQQVLVSSVSKENIISPTAKSYYGSMGYHTSVCGLVHCIYVTQHCGLKKFAIGITDYMVGEKLENVDSFAEILLMIEKFFRTLDSSGQEKIASFTQLKNTL